MNFHKLPNLWALFLIHKMAIILPILIIFQDCDKHQTSQWHWNTLWNYEMVKVIVTRILEVGKLFGLDCYALKRRLSLAWGLHELLMMRLHSILVPWGAIRKGKTHGPTFTCWWGARPVSRWSTVQSFLIKRIPHDMWTSMWTYNWNSKRLDTSLFSILRVWQRCAGNS